MARGAYFRWSNADDLFEPELHEKCLEILQENPDANAVEAIGRLPGISVLRSGGEGSSLVIRGMEPKYSNVTLEGINLMWSRKIPEATKHLQATVAKHPKDAYMAHYQLALILYPQKKFKEHYSIA